MEVNDNPNLEHGIEDTVGKDEIWNPIAEMVHRPFRAITNKKNQTSLTRRLCFSKPLAYSPVHR